jgi:hypothetical protein
MNLEEFKRITPKLKDESVALIKVEGEVNQAFETIQGELVEGEGTEEPEGDEDEDLLEALGLLGNCNQQLVDLISSPPGYLLDQDREDMVLLVREIKDFLSEWDEEEGEV